MGTELASHKDRDIFLLHQVQLTDDFHKRLEELEREQRLGQLTEKHFESSSDNVDVLPLTVVQVQVLLWGDRPEQTYDH